MEGFPFPKSKEKSTVYPSLPTTLCSRQCTTVSAPETERDTWASKAACGFVVTGAAAVEADGKVHPLEKQSFLLGALPPPPEDDSH